MPAFVIMHAPALIFTNNEPGTSYPQKFNVSVVCLGLETQVSAVGERGAGYRR